MHVHTPLAHGFNLIMENLGVVLHKAPPATPQGSPCSGQDKLHVITCSRVAAGALGYGVAAFWASGRVLQSIAQGMSSARMDRRMSCMHLQASLLHVLTSPGKQVPFSVPER